MYRTIIMILLLSSSTKASERLDLIPLLTKLQCEKEKINFLQLLNLQENLGVFDQQIQGKKIATKPNNLKTLALKFALKNHMQGFSYGTCKNGESWIASVPAPFGLKRTEESKNIFPDAELSKYCKKYELRYISALGGRSVNVSNFANLKNGTVSLMCTPKEPAWLGPQLWYLVQIGTLAQAFIGEDITQWLSEIRKKEGLSLLTANPLLDSLAKETNAQEGVLHNRKLLAAIKQKFKGSIIGEDKAIASTLSDLFNLLWYSPRHRDLLLSPDANAFGLAVEKKYEHFKITLLLAKI